MLNIFKTRTLSRNKGQDQFFLKALLSSVSFAGAGLKRYTLKGAYKNECDFLSCASSA